MSKRVSRLVAALTASLVGSSSLGCVTGSSLFDLVVPAPVARVEVNQRVNLEWSAKYGRDPEEVGHFPVRMWIDHQGTVEVPAGYERCEALVALRARPKLLKQLVPGAVGRVTWQVLADEGEANYGPPNDVSRAQAPTHCVYFLATDESDFGHFLFFDRDGKLVGEQDLPVEISILEGKRWGWLAVSPLLDALLVPIMVVGLPATGIVMLIDAVRK